MSKHSDAESALFGDSDCAARDMKRGAEALNDVYNWDEAPESVLITFTECMKSQQCAPLKHHYDECAERVTQQQEENGKADEDRKSTRLNSSHSGESRMPSSA